MGKGWIVQSRVGFQAIAGRTGAGWVVNIIDNGRFIDYVMAEPPNLYTATS